MDSHKNPNLETTEKHNYHVLVSPSSSSPDFNHDHAYNIHVSKKTNEDEGFTIKNDDEVIKNPNSLSCSGGPPPQEMGVVEESGRERLKRHRVEMAGRVWIPDIWGHEDLLKDWIDCTVFDSALGNKTIMSARAALVQEGRSTLRIENRC